MAFDTKCWVYSAGADLDGMEAMASLTISSTSARDRPGSGWGIFAMASLTMPSTWSEDTPGAESACDCEDISSRTISSTSARVSPASPFPQAARARAIAATMEISAIDRALLWCIISLVTLV